MASIKLLAFLVLLSLFFIFLFLFNQNFTGYFSKIARKNESKWYVIGKVEISNGKISSITYQKD